MVMLQPDWNSLIGRWVILNSFGLVHIAGVQGDRLLIGEGAEQTSIPLAIIHSVRLVAGGADGLGGHQLGRLAPVSGSAL